MLGNSGKVELYRATAGASDPGRMVFQFETLYERDENGNAVGNTGTPASRHTMDAPAPLAKTVNGPDRVQLGEHRVNATAVNMTLTLNGSGKLSESSLLAHFEASL